ncbi:MAG: DEAD/DEAH box helicase [Gammaproteobacteria bacterium]
MTLFAPDEWRHRASLRIQALLTSAQLLLFVGRDLEKAIRAARREEGGGDRPSNMDELADALLVARDTDLLADQAVRDALAKGHGKQGGERIDVPRRWHPGQSAALNFTEALGLPPELAGVRAGTRPELFVQVRPPAPFRELEPYQQSVCERMLKPLGAGAPDNRAIVSLPTGSGKTRVAVQTLHEWTHRVLREGSTRQAVVVWLAHTEELCEQAVACFEDVWRSRPGGEFSLGLIRYWGGYATSFARSGKQEEMMGGAEVVVVVSIPYSFENKPDLLDAMGGPANLNAMVIDEAHRAGAPTYTRLISEFGERTPIIGLTATPFAREYVRTNPHAGTERLRALFHDLIEPEALGEDPRVTLQEMGVLARPRVHTVTTNYGVSFDTLPDEDDDQQVLAFDQQLSQKLDQTKRRRVVVRTLLELLADDPMAQVLYFGPSVTDAETVAFLLRRKGHAAAAVSGDTRTSTRRTLIRDFREQRLQVLCNCEVLTTGFDAPRVTHVVMARATISQVLYEQMVGRGLRGPRFGGTELCHIIDFEDRYRGPRPVLGWQRFRAVWTPDAPPGETPAPSTPEAPGATRRPDYIAEHVGMIIRLGQGEPFRVYKDANGRALQATRPFSRGGRTHARARLVGTGESGARLRVWTQDTQGKTRPVTQVVLSQENGDQAFTLQAEAGQRMVFESLTPGPSTCIEVSRVVS